MLVDVAGAHTVGAHEPFLKLLDAVQRAAASAAYAPASATAAAVEAEAEEVAGADGVPFAARCAEAAVGAIVVAYVEEVLLSAADATALELEPELAATLVELVGVAPTAAARLPRAARAQLLHALQRAAPAVAPLASALRALPKLGPAGSVEWLRLRENALAPPPAAAAATARVAVFRAINAAANEVQGSATAAKPPAADVAAAAPPLPPMSAEEIKSAATLGGGAESAAALLRRTDALDRLEAVAQAKRRVVAYAAALIEVLRDGGAAAGRAATALLNSSADARKLLTSGMVGPRQIQVMVLRLVWRAGGMPLLGKVLALPRNATEWVPVDASVGAALMQATPLLDPFRWLLPDQQARGAAYGGIVKMTKTILTFRGRDASELTRLDKWVGDRVKEKTSLFAVVAAAFSLTSEVLMPEGALKRETEDPVGEQMLRTAGIGRLASDGVRELCLWVLDGCDGGALGRGLVPPQHPRNPTKPKGKRRQQLLLQLTVDVALRATMQADTWWHAVLFRPAELIRGYVPTMSGEESLDVMRSLSEFVAWYKCPNGHLYSVGNCTRPMQMASCPECGKPIGGQSHNDARGVTRLGTMEDIASSGMTGAGRQSRSTKGYHRDDLNTFAHDFALVQRAGPVAARVLRIFMHVLLHASMVAAAERRAAVCSLLKFPTTLSGEKSSLEHLAHAIHRDWEALSEQFGLDDDELALALHSVAARLGHSSSPKTLATEAARSTFEVAFQNDAVRPVFGSGVASVVRAAQAELQPADRTLAFRRALGEELWADVTSDDGEPAADSLRWLWTPPADCSLELLARDFGMRAGNARRYPVVASVLRLGERLPLIRYAADVLRWHAVLFEALGGAGAALRRADAASITNAQAVERLPAERQPAAWEALRAFCDGFNAAFPLVERLFECQANPFLYDDGAGRGAVAIDLAGVAGALADGPVKMSPAVAVTFSLPSVVAGDNDAPGLCTVQLLNTLSQLHADAMNQLHAGGSPLLPRAAAAADAAVPTISHNTPYEVMRRQLLSFDPAVHLLPRLVALRRDAADEAAGGSAFDLAALERSLVASVLAVATPLQIHIHHFAYAGELQRSGSSDASASACPSARSARRRSRRSGRRSTRSSARRRSSPSSSRRSPSWAPSAAAAAAARRRRAARRAAMATPGRRGRRRTRRSRGTRGARCC